MAARRPRDARPAARLRPGARRHDRPFRDPLGQGRAHASGTRTGVERSRIPVESRRRDPQRPAGAGHRAARHAVRHGALGERRAQAERRPEELDDVRRLRLRGGEAVSVRAQVDGLERAEPASLARAHVAEPLRDAAAQSGLRGDPPREPPGARRRRRHRSTREHRRLRADQRVAAEWLAAHAKLDAYAHNPYATQPARVSVPRRLSLLRRDLDVEPEPAHEGSCSATSVASRSG